MCFVGFEFVSISSGGARTVLTKGTGVVCKLGDTRTKIVYVFEHAAHLVLKPMRTQYGYRPTYKQCWFVVIPTAPNILEILNYVVCVAAQCSTTQSTESRTKISSLPGPHGPPHSEPKL